MDGLHEERCEAGTINESRPLFPPSLAVRNLYHAKKTNKQKNDTK